jgi:hypothetical protein
MSNNFMQGLQQGANDDANSIGRAIVEAITELRTSMDTLNDSINTLFGNTQTTGSFTMGAAASTVVPQSAILTTSRVFLIPTNAAAATLVGSVESPYISAKSAGVSFTVTCASGAASGTETFDYVVINPLS